MIMKVVSDIEFIEQTNLFGKQNYYLLGSEEINSYIKMPNRLVCYAKEIVNYLKENDVCLEEIQAIVAEKFPKRTVDVKGFVDKLYEAGLIEGSEKQFDSEAGLLMLKLINVKFKEKSNKKRCKILYFIFSKPYIVFPLAVAFLVISGILHGFIKNIEYASSWTSFSIDFVIIISLSILCFFIHESSHVIAASNNMVAVKTFTFGLYLGFMPMLYFTYRNIKKASSRSKFKIIVAGVYMNLLSAIISYAICLFFPTELVITKIFYLFALLNFLLCIMNLYPSRFGDGYYILSLLTNKFDIRLSVWKNIFGINKAKRQFNLTTFLYSIIMFLSILYALIGLVFRMIKFFQEGNFVYGYWLAISFAISIVSTVISVGVAIKKRKRNNEKFSNYK